MFFRIGKIFVVLTLAAMLGAHWTLLQTVAWTSMLADNLQKSSFQEAVAKTFDGRHPCCLCKAIAAARKSEKKSEAVASGFKLEFPPARENPVLVAPTHFHFLPLTDIFSDLLTQPPLSPPPRAALA